MHHLIVTLFFITLATLPHCFVKASSRNARIFLHNFENNLNTIYKDDQVYFPYYSQQNTTYLYYHDQTIYDQQTYDFIIVGSGSSGSVLANRLSENQNWNILLLEVGEEASFLTDIPAIAPAFQFTNYDWAYKMEKQENVCLGCPNQRMHWPRGRALGGSTIINFMINVRGNPLDYDRWEQSGNPGWGWNDVLPYFKKMEDANINVQDYGYHNIGGYLPVSDVPFRSKLVQSYVKAAQEYGLNYVDYNGKSQLGISFIQSTTRRGKRFSAEKAYLRTASHRKNLKIITKAYVTQVLIEKKSKKAYGVIFTKNRKSYTIYSRKEVILSAGAFNSPQLLMLSGVGPKKDLEKIGIEVIQNLPVGKKMYDHLTFMGLNFEIDNVNHLFQQQSLEDPSNYLNLLLNGKGPLTTIGTVEAIGYFKTNVSNDVENYPDMEILICGASLNTDRGLVYKNIMSVAQDVYDQMWKPLENKAVFLVLPMLVHPKSYGHLKLKSKNPYHRPLLYGNYFTDKNNIDIKTFIAAIRVIQKINDSPSLQKLGSKLVKFNIRGCSNIQYDSDEFWACALRHNAPTLHHQIATCKMGPASDPEAVVDSQLRVYGISNLRVVDTSIIPLPLTAHTSTPAYMIGEKAADIIKNDYEVGHNILSKADIRRNANF